MPPSLARFLGGLLLLVLPVAALAAEPRTDPIYEGKRLSAWLDLLQSKDEKERRDARQALVSLVKQGRTAVGSLVEALLEIPSDRQRLLARVEMLAQLGPAAVPRLTAALWDEDSTRRALAVIALGRLGSAAREAVPSLLERLKDENSLMRGITVETLGGMSARSAIPALIGRLDDKDQQVRETATSVLIHLRVEAKLLLPTFLRWLTVGPTAQRRLAALALAELGPEAASTVPALVKALDDEDRDLRHAVLRALASIGPSAKEAIDSLRALLKDKERAGNHLAASEALWLIARHADALAWLEARTKRKPGAEQIETARRLWRYARSPKAVTALAEMVASGMPPARRGALAVLREIGPSAKAALPAVLPLLKDEDRNVRFAAIAFVGRLGEHGKDAVPALEKMLDGEDHLEQWWSAWALWHVQKDRRVVPLLLKRLQDKDIVVRTTTVALLKQIGPAAKGAVGPLRKALHDKDARLRLAGAAALWKVDQHPDAQSTLVRLLRDGDPSVRNDASLCLGAELGPKALPAVPSLVKAMWDEDSQAHCAAAEALGRVGPAASPAVGALVAVLRSGQEDGIQSAAAETLGLIGPRARSTVPVLLQKLKDHDSLVRVHAALALWRIDRKREGLPAALAGLQDRSYRTRITAAEALWSLKRDSQAVSTLLTALADADRQHHSHPNNARYMAARALGRIGPPARAAMPALRHLLDEEDEDLRATADAALKAVNAKPPVIDKEP